jgi:hypothetical protein
LGRQVDDCGQLLRRARAASSRRSRIRSS